MRGATPSQIPLTRSKPCIPAHRHNRLDEAQLCDLARCAGVAPSRALDLARIKLPNGASDHLRRDEHALNTDQVAALALVVDGLALIAQPEPYRHAALILEHAGVVAPQHVASL